jgi:hypothetical protein
MNNAFGRKRALCAPVKKCVKGDRILSFCHSCIPSLGLVTAKSQYSTNTSWINEYGLPKHLAYYNAWLSLMQTPFSFRKRN